MDIDEAKNLIEEPRGFPLALTLNSGEKYVLPPGSRAVDHGTDTLLVLIPREGVPDAFLGTGRSFYVGAVNIASLEPLQQTA
ncbi:MAG: hypothetical protein AAF586_09125 [Planctomycetota bacterium]